jgi:hypothetical protein
MDDPKEPQPAIKYSEHGQGYFDLESFESEASEINTTDTNENTGEPPEAIEAVAAIEVSPETTAGLGQTTLDAAELVEAPETDAQTPEKKVPSKQEKLMLDMLADARRAEWAKTRVDRENWHSPSERADLLRTIKLRNQDVRAAIASGLYKFRKGQPTLLELKKEDRDPKTRDNVTWRIFTAVRYDADFQAALTDRLQDSSSEFTFADLLEMRNREAYRGYGRVGTHAHYVHEALKELEEMADAIAAERDRREIINSRDYDNANEEELEQILQRDEDDARDRQEPAPAKRVYKITKSEDQSIDRIADGAHVSYAEAFRRVTGQNYDDYDNIEIE